MTTVQSTKSDTAIRILDTAERLVQERGFNGFSYADISAEIGITTASLHYHFGSKAELGSALITRYSERFMARLSVIEQDLLEADRRLQAYADVYAEVLREGRLCLCGMLAAEYDTLPEIMRSAVVAFFDDNETWLARVLDEGRRTQTLVFTGEPEDTARMFVGALEGAMLVARPYGDVARFETAARHLIASVQGNTAVAS